MNGFENKLENAKGMLEKLMNPEITLADSVKYYKSGMDELKSAQKMLEEAKLEYEEIKAGYEEKGENDHESDE